VPPSFVNNIEQKVWQAWEPCFFIPTLLTTRQIGSLGVWFSPFLLGQAKFPGGQMMAV
jgi:hypothetical protein